MREHGEECSNPSKLERDEEHSKPDQEAWLITCEEATYRVIYEGGRISSEHIYWDHVTVLLQLGVIKGPLPALGADQAERLLNPDAPANTMIGKFS